MLDRGNKLPKAAGQKTRAVTAFIFQLGCGQEEWREGGRRVCDSAFDTATHAIRNMQAAHM